MTAHFKLLALAAAGIGNDFIITQLTEQLAFHIRYLRSLDHVTNVRVALTDLSDIAPRVEAEVFAKLNAAHVHWDPDRAGGRGYYQVICFKIFITEPGGGEIEIGDGGATDWTAKLLSNAKERFISSGLSLERLCLANEA